MRSSLTNDFANVPWTIPDFLMVFMSIPSESDVDIANRILVAGKGTNSRDR